MAGPLSLLFAIISLALSVLFRPHIPPIEEREAAEKNRWVAVVLTSVIVLVFGAIASVAYTAVHKPDLRVANQIKPVGDTGMTNGDKAIINILAPPLGRKYLAMTLRLVNPSQTGNCVGPTQLEITPIAGDLVGDPPPKLVSSMEEFRLSIANSTQPGIQVRTVNETPGCSLNLEVQDAVLYNGFPW